MARATASAARTTTCRRSSSLISQGAATETDQPHLLRRLWGSGFLPTHIRGSSSAPARTRSSTCRTRRGSTRDIRRTDARRPRQAQPDGSPKRVGDPEIKTRIAQYEMAYRMQTLGPRADRPRRRSRADVIDLVRRHDAEWPAASRRTACSPRRDGRARRPLRAALPPRLGPARQPAEADPRPVQGRRPGVRGPDQRPRSARPARRHAGDLGRRVRPHRLQPRDADRRPTTAATITPAASRCGWPAAASSRASPTARPTTSATTSSKDPVHVHDLNATILHCLGI